MHAIDALLSRASVSRLDPPVPTGEDLDRILAAVSRAPDHGALTPWRLLVVTGQGLSLLADAGAASLRRRDPEVAARDLDRAREKLTRAPMVIALAGRITPDHKVPEIEQLLSVGAAGMNLLNALHALGYAGKWVTGASSHDPAFARDLGFADGERLCGLFMVGTAASTEDRAEPGAAPFVRYWN